VAINQKGSRKIVVDGHIFRWRATGDDGCISLVIWSVENQDSRLIGWMGYHSYMMPIGVGVYQLTNQIIITNRVVRTVILRYGADNLIKNTGRVNIGSIESLFDIQNAIRAKK
jgi:hypothetical protein